MQAQTNKTAASPANGPLEIPAGCYDPTHWLLANGLEPIQHDRDAPEEQRPPRGKPYLTEAALEQRLEDWGITVRLNTVSHEVEIGGLSTAYDPENVRNDLPVVLYGALRQEFRCSRQDVTDLLNLIAGKNRCNPVLELILCGEWDRTDYLGQLVDILGLGREDLLSQTLLYKWCVQSWRLLQNQPGMAVGADGMLVLQGPQGCGKTSFARQIAIRPEFCKLGQWLDPRDKDTLRRCTSAWIVELGEIETTLRSDLERLKAFITNEVDEYRLPYARADSRSPRRTSLIGTCNSRQFLIDPTGSRRFWTVPVERMDLERLRQFPALQFWRQIRAICGRDPEEFRLTAEERRQLAERNGAHEKPLKAQAEVEDILAEAEADPGRYQWRAMTVSEFREEHASLRRYDVAQIGRALDRVGITVQRARQSGQRIRLRELPCHRWGRVRAEMDRGGGT